MSGELPPRVGINAIFPLAGMGGLETDVRELVGELIRAAPSTRFRVYCSPAGERHLLWTYFSVPLHRMPAVRFGPIAGELRCTEQLASRILSLPMPNDRTNTEIGRGMPGRSGRGRPTPSGIGPERSFSSRLSAGTPSAQASPRVSRLS